MITTQTFITLFSSIFTLFLMVIPGFILRKSKIGGDSLAISLTNVILYVSSPAMIINAFLREYDSALLKNMIAVFVLSFFAHCIFALITYALLRKKHGVDVRVYRFASIFANAGYMGIPLIQMVFGGAAGIYASVYIIWFNVFTWTLGCLIYTGDKKYITLKKAIINPAVIPIIIGVGLFLGSLSRYIPSLVCDVVSSLNGTVAPLSMMLVGFRLADVNFKSALRDSRFYLALALRLIIGPILVFALMAAVKLLGIELSEIVMSTVLVCASTPTAVATTMFAEKFGGDGVLASQIVSASTILSLGTIPLVSALLLIPIPSLF